MALSVTDIDRRSLVGQAVELSQSHVEQGGIPFAALVVDIRGRVVASGVNRVVSGHDPLAHAEIVAMRAAAVDLGHYTLTGATLIASGEPCGLCYLAARYFGIGEVVYAVDRDQAARFGFDYRGSYRLFADPPEQWASMSLEHLQVDNGLRPFESWQERHEGRA